MHTSPMARTAVVGVRAIGIGRTATLGFPRVRCSALDLAGAGTSRFAPLTLHSAFRNLLFGR